MKQTIITKKKQKDPPVSKTNGSFCHTKNRARLPNRVTQTVGDITYGPRCYSNKY